MVITLDHNLPTEDELTVPELKLSGPALRAGAFHLGKYCQDTFNVRIIRYLYSFHSKINPINAQSNGAQLLYEVLEF